MLTAGSKQRDPIAVCDAPAIVFSPIGDHIHQSPKTNRGENPSASPPGGSLNVRPPTFTISALRVDELKKFIYGGHEEIQKELSALLRSYEIPEEYAGEARRRLKELIREEVRRRGLQEEDWLIDALYRILIHMACATL